MIKNGWFEKYYYVYKVMNGNKTAKNVRCQTSTIIWGEKVLDQYLKVLIKKYPKLKKAFYEVESPYYEDLRRLDEEVFDQIVENVRNENSKKETNNSN